MSERMLISYYGDDFTGSTDVMEALSANGVPTVLFTRIPESQERLRFSGYRAVGLAGQSRSRPPDWMDRMLPQAFDWLRSLGAGFCHYKICSTFDSAPGRGSIGRAIEIGLRTFGQHRTALIVGAPQLGRYTFAGHLFATYRDSVFRIDRHPVMSRHPATPMNESDLLVHLGAQTDLPSTLLDQLGPTGPIADDNRIVLIDVHDNATQARAGALVADPANALGPFIVGSSGVEYALLSAWRDAGLIGKPGTHEPATPKDRIAVVSGSCSETTERQIRAAEQNGFAAISVDYGRIASGEGLEHERARALDGAAKALRSGLSPIVHTALGPQSVATSDGTVGDDTSERVGRFLGALLDTLRREFSLDRLVIAGGDTSSTALGELDVVALTLRHPIAASPGSPLCNAWTRSPGDTFEIALKGGQIGNDDYFMRLRDGMV
ncbi:four-carbon acid sugar kinase family protein [Oricola thermophila]|uniref:Four-carbon acid sugar kinase family protein n=1 Tax=Oricola thermophila TaxID=2742145 RepID=A0A6N1VBZ9_9HYPH|nr:four-carbon acid sugar kinase family protein [Oricola thermophila]QKV18541.1 four-carbon acid sugar kinase family protein [Oricola thermophila]